MSLFYGVNQLQILILLRKSNMIINFEWKSGLVFGIEADQIYSVDEVDDVPDFENEEPHPVIYVHLGIISLCLMF
jgi:hypothetical protein